MKILNNKNKHQIEVLNLINQMIFYFQNNHYNNFINKFNSNLIKNDLHKFTNKDEIYIKECLILDYK